MSLSVTGVDHRLKPNRLREKVDTFERTAQQDGQEQLHRRVIDIASSLKQCVSVRETWTIYSQPKTALALVCTRRDPYTL